ncbi:MAG: hypothetical protein EAY81_03360 [Bacteroidetes bacterium]|nr:MAG: hypothetical protein EAY81_03360 [Bacteroidota bacterium]
MSENKNQQSLPDDEFDIEVLASKLWNIQKKILRKLWYPIALLKSNPKKLAISLTLSLVLSVILRFTIPPVFESSFIIRPFNPTDLVSSAMLEDLSTLIEDRNDDDLAKYLKLDKSICEKLFRLTHFRYYKNEYRKDTISGLHITLLMTNPRLIDTFQHAIINNYLEESDYFKRYVTVRQQELDYMEQLLLKDIVENDSLRHLVASSVAPRSGGGFVFGEPLDPQKVYQSGYELQQQLMKVRTNKEYNQSFILAKSGIARLKPYFPRMTILFPVLALLAILYCLFTNRIPQPATKAT